MARLDPDAAPTNAYWIGQGHLLEHSNGSIARDRMKSLRCNCLESSVSVPSGTAATPGHCS